MRTLKKTFWQKPEGVTGAVFMVATMGALGFGFIKILPWLIATVTTTLHLVVLLSVLACLLYVILDPKMRNLVWYGYKSTMRWITGVFVSMDPVGILKSYVEDLKDKLVGMDKQIGLLGGQIIKLQSLFDENAKEIKGSLELASAAKRQQNESQMIINTRKAARLKDTNSRYDELLRKMNIIYKILAKMYKNSEIIIMDTDDQIKMKEQEYIVIEASHRAMNSARSIIQGGDKREMFDMAVESIADDVANKVGEMERFMEVSASFMDSIDLQNGVFEEEGYEMLQRWEEQSMVMMLPTPGVDSGKLNLNDTPLRQPDAVSVKQPGRAESYDSLFN